MRTYKCMSCGAEFGTKKEKAEHKKEYPSGSCAKDYKEEIAMEEDKKEYAKDLLKAKEKLEEMKAEEMKKKNDKGPIFVLANVIVLTFASAFLGFGVFFLWTIQDVFPEVLVRVFMSLIPACAFAIWFGILLVEGYYKR